MSASDATRTGGVRMFLAIAMTAAVLGMAAFVLTADSENAATLEETTVAAKTATKAVVDKASLHRLAKNCLTAKAYAIVAKDDLLDQKGDSMGVVKDMMLALAPEKPGNKYNTPKACMKQYKHFITMYQMMHDDKDSIPYKMLISIRKSMEHAGGVLTWGDRTLKRGLFVYIDGKKVGLAGTPSNFKKVGKRSLQIRQELNKMKVHGHRNIKKKPGHFVFTKKMFNYLFHGACLDSRTALAGGYSFHCQRHTRGGPRVCRRHTGCSWSGPWKGNEEEEEEMP